MKKTMAWMLAGTLSLGCALIAQAGEMSGATNSDRAQFIADEKATKYTSVNVEELQVTVFGETAVGRALITYKGIEPKGKAFISHSRWTDAWVKMPDGKWQCVATHGSNVKM